MNYMKKLHYIILSVLVGAMGTIMHFFHHVEVSDEAWTIMCHFLPTSETCWEHLKLILYPMIVLAVIFWIKHRSVKAIGGTVLAMTLTIPLSIVLYYIFEAITPEGEFIHDIVLYWVEIFFAVWLSLKWTPNERIGRLWPVLIGVTVGWIIAFYVLTFNHPDWDLFRVPEAWAKDHPEALEEVKGHRTHE